MKSEVYKRKVDMRDELLTLIVDAAAHIKKREDQVRRTTRDFWHTSLQNALRVTLGFSTNYCEL